VHCWTLPPKIHRPYPKLSNDVPTSALHTVQCSAQPFSTVQCSAVQCSAVQCSSVQCSAVQCHRFIAFPGCCPACPCDSYRHLGPDFPEEAHISTQCSTVQYTVLSTVQCSAVQCSGKYSTVTTVLRSTALHVHSQEQIVWYPGERSKGNLPL
jgi:hypothetical protein